MTEVACWAHVRRKFYDIHVATNAPIAGEALQRIGQLFDIERAAMGLAPEKRRRIRQSRARPVMDDLAAFLDASLATISGRSELAGAIRYARSRWTALTRYLDDGRLEISNNAAERAIRPLATRRSLCSPFSSICKHSKLASEIGATRATCSRDGGGDPFVLQVGGSDLVRSAWHDLLGGKDAVLDEAADAMARDAERRRGLGHREPFAVLLGGAIGADAMHRRSELTRCAVQVFPDRGHPPSLSATRRCLGPTIALPCYHHRERLFGVRQPC